MSSLSSFKRCYEYYQADDDFRKLMDKSAQQAVESIGLYDEDPQLISSAIRKILHKSISDADIDDNRYIRAYYLYNQEITNNVDELIGEDTFRFPGLYEYEAIVRNRCYLECATERRYAEVRFFPVCYELSKGCRVQCDFCGLDAEKFCGNFDYNEQNAKLFGEILEATKQVVGDVASNGPLYFATEPMDNPDYEKFITIFDNVFGKVPQTTTAIADMNADRIKSMIATLGTDRVRKEELFRFSVRTKSQFHRIMESFTPEELEYIELFPNNPEAITTYSNAGRIRDIDSGSIRFKINYSICCVAGIKVNFYEKSVSFIEPEVPDEEYPTGVNIKEKKFFSNASEYKTIISDMYAKYACSSITEDGILSFNKHITITKEAGKLRFAGDLISFDMSDGLIISKAIELIQAGSYSFGEIAGCLGVFGDMYKDLYDKLNILYARGYLRINNR